MANTLWDSGREAFLGGDAAWDSDDFRVILLDDNYTYSSAHTVLTDITGGGRVATSGALGSKTITAGVADAGNVTFSAVASGTTVTHFLIYKHTGVEGTSLLIAHFDSATNMPLITNGGDITVQWDDGANKIFKL